MKLQQNYKNYRNYKKNYKNYKKTIEISEKLHKFLYIAILHNTYYDLNIQQP